MKKLFLLPLMLILAVVAQGQSFIGCRIDGGWAETPKLRKTFTIKKNELKRYDFQTLTFHISVTSLGYHEVYINGVKVGERVLQPAVSQLDKRALEVTYDITDTLSTFHFPLPATCGMSEVSPTSRPVSSASSSTSSPPARATTPSSTPTARTPVASPATTTIPIHIR